jgi:hypothetical protein
MDGCDILHPVQKIVEGLPFAYRHSLRLLPQLSAPWGRGAWIVPVAGREAGAGVFQIKAGTRRGHILSSQVLEFSVRFLILAHLENCAGQQCGAAAPKG